MENEMYKKRATKLIFDFWPKTFRWLWTAINERLMFSRTIWSIPNQMRQIWTAIFQLITLNSVCSSTVCVCV